MTDPAASDTSAGGGHSVHSEAVWDYVRRDYLDGESASIVCARYGIARSTFWDRAAAGGWRRCDQPPAALPPIPVNMPEGVNLQFDEMFALIHARLSQAIVKGRAAEVSAWLRVVDQMHRPLQEYVELLREARAHTDAFRGPGPDSSDSSD